MNPDTNNAASAPPADGELILFRLENVTVSPLNPRRDLKPEGIEEIAESILEHGIIQPPSARLVDGKPELMFGQRRYFGLCRAVQLAEQRDLPARNPEQLRDGKAPASRADELSWMPIITRVMNDTEAEELMLVENLQREEVTARDEANGYARLLELHSENGGRLYTVERLGQKIGKSAVYVTNRLKLRMAPAGMWEAYEAGLIGTRHLELVGRIPHPKSRDEAAALILKPRYQDHPLNVIQATEMIREKFMVSLRSCGFDLADDKLLPIQYQDGVRVSGGDCNGCEFRSGNDPALQGELQEKGCRGKAGIDPRLCTNTACFAAKQEAGWKRMKSNAEDNGRRVMDVDQSQAIFAPYGDMSVLPHSGLVDLAESPDFFATGNHGSADEMEPWEEQLKGTDAAKKAIVVRHPVTKKIHFLIEREEAVKLAEAKLREEGKASPFANRPAPVARAGQRSKAEIDKERADREKASQMRLICDRLFTEQLEDKLNAADVRSGTHGVWDHLLRAAFIAAVMDEGETVMNWLGIDEKDYDGVYDGADLWDIAVDRVKARTMGGNTLPVIGMLLTLSIMPYQLTGDDKALDGIARALGIDLKDIRKQAEKRIADAAKDAKKPKGKEELHTCEKRQAKAMLHATADPAEFARLAATVEVPKMKQNEHGVYCAPVVVRLDLPGKKAYVSLELACDERGPWSTGYFYEAGKLDKSCCGGGGHPNKDGFWLSRTEAVKAWFSSMIVHFEKPASMKPLVDQLRAAQTVFAAAVEYYHCDKCHDVCAVNAADVAAVEAMQPGDFLCHNCGPVDGPGTLIGVSQAEFEVWPVEKK